MDPILLSLLALAVFGASMLQAATGIGYGVIAGPIFLVALNGAEAIQISTLHNFLIAILLVPVLRHGIDKGVLKCLALGSIAGIAVGFMLQSTLSVVALKLIAAVMVGFVALTLVFDMRRKRRVGSSPDPSITEISVVGAFSGIMGGMLAMPGPLAATWMSIRAFEKNTVRATILAFFIFAYGANILSYVSTWAFDRKTLELTAILTPFLALGIVSGGVVSRKLSEALFRKILLCVLILTAVTLVFSLF